MNGSGSSPALTKLQDLSSKLATCFQYDSGKEVECVERFTLELLQELVRFVEAEENAKIPDFIFKRLNDKEFHEFLSNRGRLDMSDALAVTAHLERTVALDLEKAISLLGQPNPNSTFVANVTLALTEELIHLLHPELSEEEVCPKDIALAEKFLEYQFPEEHNERMRQAVKGK